MEALTFDAFRMVVAVCAALITAFLTPYLYTLRDDKKYAKVFEIIKVAVRAAEQTFKEAGQGEAKKAEVLRFVTEWLNKRGISITDKELDNLIECAVFQIKNNGNT